MKTRIMLICGALMTALMPVMVFAEEDHPTASYISIDARAEYCYTV